MIRDLEQKTREVVEAEQRLARSRRELVDLRDRLLSVVGGKTRKEPQVPAKLLAVVRVLEQATAPMTREDVASALGVSVPCATARLQRAIAQDLIERVRWGRYGLLGRDNESSDGAAATD